MLIQKKRHPFCSVVSYARIRSIILKPQPFHSNCKQAAKAKELSQSSTTLKMPVALTIKKIEGKPGKVYYP